MAVESPCPDRATLEGLLEGTLSDDRQADVTRHIEDCPECRRRLEELAGGTEWLAVEACAARQPADEPSLRQVIDGVKAQRPAPERAAAGGAGGVSLDWLDPPERREHLGHLAEYDILEVIGRGGMGIVFKARDRGLDRCVAIKVLSPHLASDAAARERFVREAQRAAAVSHDHVVAIHAVGEVKGLPYLVMEYVAGVSLDARIKRTGPLKLEEILRIGMQTAAGLAAAHLQGLAHRDIKPANILLENGVERVKITDFGLARTVDDAQITQSGVVAGTPEYMSPEQARGEPVDARSDLFSLGGV
ncbi:MAG: serine/threonine protein kinase, partial [Thermoguttaceae bacterium]|nr:serine/threonine protein kinase [Thermoguttaceae bacterium]